MTTINKQISLGTDDCEEAGATLYLTSTTMYMGHPDSVYNCGFRWQSINIAQGTTITSAKFSLYMIVDAGTLSTNISAIDEDNTATWSSGSRPSDRTKTTATITANEANWNNWGTSGWIDIDITSIVQEVIERDGWSANNALAIVVEDTAGAGSNYINVRAYEYSTALCAKLDIVYTSAGASMPAIIHHLQEQGIS